MSLRLAEQAAEANLELRKRVLDDEVITEQARLQSLLRCQLGLLIEDGDEQ